MRLQLLLVAAILFGSSMQASASNIRKAPYPNPAIPTQTAVAAQTSAPVQAAVVSQSSNNNAVAFAVAAQSTWRVHAGTAYTDSQGNLWSADENFTGGTGTGATTTAIAKALPNSTDQALYQSQRYGTSFSYSFPVPAGSYQVTLKFAETYWTGAGQRVFNTAINGSTVLTNFDIFASAGGQNIALDKVFNNITASNGMITINFGPASADNACIQAIQIIPQPSTWRVHAGGPAYTDKAGNVWAADENYTGGTAASPSTSAVSGTSDSALYQYQRYGNPFSYSFPVPPGSYQVTLKFAETYWSGAGQRVFNASINGSAILTNFDIFASAGGANIALDKVFNNISPSNGTITLNFGPASVDNAVIQAIQIVPQPVVSTSTFTTSPTFTFTGTPTGTPTFTPTPSNTPTLTFTNTWTNTPTVTLTFTNSPTPTTTFTFTNSPTQTTTFTFSNTPTVPNTSTSTSTMTSTNSMTSTNTSTTSPTATNSPTLTNTWTKTNTTAPTSTFTAVPPPATHLVGYLPDYGGNFATFATTLNWSKMTHLNICFVNPPTCNGTCTGGSNMNFSLGQTDADIATLVNAAHAHGVKVLASIGGAGGDAQIVQFYNAGLSSQLVSSLNTWVTNHNLDGVDLDIEQPNNVGANYSTFAQDCINTFHSQGKLVTAATAQYISQGNMSTATLESFDFLNVMVYDNLSLCQQAVSYYSSVGEPKNKIVLGVPFFGSSGGNEPTWAQIVAAYPNAGASNSVSGGSLYNGAVITYVGFTEMAQETQLGGQYGGVMIWDLSQDAPAPNSLYSVIVNNLNVGSPTPTPTPVVASTWRVNAGGPSYTDKAGNVWAADENFTGGTQPSASTNTVSGTTDSALYQTQRYGNPFSYTFNVPAGSYQVTLKFAETYWTAAGQRVFNVAINGSTVLTNFDIFATAGGANIAVDKVFSNISPSNGTITINFGPVSADNAVIQAIQIVPQAVFTNTPTATATLTPTATSTPLPQTVWRVGAGNASAYTDKSGNVWSADENFTGGTAATASTTTVSGTSDSTLYQNQRYGNPFSYSFPLPAGSYQVTLKFAETYWTASGQRLFNASINGTQVLTNFDIFASAGGANIALDKVFNNISPANGTITLNFGPASVDNACIQAIQIIPQGIVTVTPTATATSTANGAPPNFGPNVIIFDPGMSSSTIQTQINNIYNTQAGNQFGSARYALLFKPGTYNNTVSVGYYTQVLGLGTTPDAVLINGGVVSNAALPNGNATCNFWEGAENMAVSPSGGTDKWAVSQACPMRRMHIKGNIVLADTGSQNWSSGGFLGDSLVDGQVNSSSQQQWLSRNNQWGSWAGASWNMVFVGDINSPSGANWPNPADTVINTTPMSREKPFLQIDGSGNYSVFVPAFRTSSTGTSWSTGTEAGTAIPISQFYIAQASTDTSASLNVALAAGKNLLLTPGVYSLTSPLQVNNANTVVLGLGLATLLAQNGTTAMQVADVDGVIIAGILFDAGATSSPILLQVGPTGSSASHTTNPTLLSDLFFRIGGAAVGKAVVSLQINSNNVIGDDFWIWRADHSNGVGWTSNTAQNGLVVNGNNVTIYGLACEHFQQYQTLWNGNGGSVYFYQSEEPYDVPQQSQWMNGTENGYASYKVANTVTTHQAYGLGIYNYFTANTSVVLDNAIEVPAAGLDGGMIHNMTTVGLGGGGYGSITAIIDGYGTSTLNSSAAQRLAQ